MGERKRWSSLTLRSPEGIQIELTPSQTMSTMFWRATGTKHNI